MLQPAERGDARAQLELGQAYAKGDGVEKDMGKSFFWIRQAAEQGHASSQNSLGLCYLHGKGVPRDRGEAFK